MGLTIHYNLRVVDNLSSAVVRELAGRTALYARKIGCAEVGEVMRVNFDTPFTSMKDHRFGRIPAKRGWVVDVWPGEGCESTLFGLCQYPRFVPFRVTPVPTGYQGWELTGHCKTQYAGEHGWEHFLKCHRQVISLLNFWRELGVTVEVMDEGEYWETRSEEKLEIRLGQYDRLIAALGGMFKDAAAESAPGLKVEAPIFDYAHFERLEHEGRQEFGCQIGQLKKEGPQKTPSPGPVTKAKRRNWRASCKIESVKGMKP